MSHSHIVEVTEWEGLQIKKCGAQRGIEERRDANIRKRGSHLRVAQDS